MSWRWNYFYFSPKKKEKLTISHMMLVSLSRCFFFILFWRPSTNKPEVALLILQLSVLCIVAAGNKNKNMEDGPDLSFQQHFNIIRIKSIRLNCACGVAEVRTKIKRRRFCLAANANASLALWLVLICRYVGFMNQSGEKRDRCGGTCVHVQQVAPWRNG